MGSLYDDLKKAGELLDKVFGNIYCITGKSEEIEHPIDVSTLNDHQLLIIYDSCKIISETLTKCKEREVVAVSSPTKKRKLLDISTPDTSTLNTTSDYEHERKKTLVLREYLIQELNYSEKLEIELLQTKEELANAIRREEINNKQHESRIMELLAYNTEYRADVGAATESIIGRYVKKLFHEYGTFHGLITSYDHPYYKVIYEDGDVEEMTREETVSIMVDTESVPEDAILQCKHSFDEIERGRNPHVTPRLTTDVISSTRNRP